jgi:hypothetical protein
MHSETVKLGITVFTKFRHWNLPGCSTQPNINETLIRRRGLGRRSGLGAALLVRRSRDQLPVVSLDFSVTFPSDRTMVLRSIEPIVKMSTRNISGGEAAGA